MYKLCIFAGTSEGRTLIEGLSGRGLSMTACVATEYGETLLGEHPDVEIRAGRMNEAEMEAMLQTGGFSLIVDATHPYASVATENIARACKSAGVEYLRLLRGSASTVEDGVFVESAAHCVQYLKNTTGNVLLTTGSKDLSAYCEICERIYARVLPMAQSLALCAAGGIAPERIIAMQGPFDEEMNLALLRAVKAKYMVTKDSGNAGGYDEKIRAAKRAGVQPIIIGRPPQRKGLDLDAMLSLLEKRFSLPAQRKRVVLAGVGMGDCESRSMGLERAVREADCLIGARRMLESVDSTGKTTYAAVSAKAIADYIRTSAAEKFAVLFSGDIGFYSGAKALLAELAEMDVELIPSVGSLQYFCAKLRRPWEDVRAVSLHGRDCDLADKVRRNPAVFALLGGSDGAKSALLRLQQAGLGDLPLHIGQRLGYPEEEICHGTANTLLDGRFASLSVLLVENPNWLRHVVTHGLPDERFERDETPMTKCEVRAVSLSKLALTQGAVVYDVGSGSGSTCVECALQANRGRVYAIEMKEKALALTRKNRDRFGLTNLEVVAGRAPEAFSALEAPTHAFIGGSTGSMRGIIHALLEKNPQVRIVANTVTLETLAELSEIAKEFDFCDIVEINVSKPRSLGSYRLMTAQNPVFIFTLQNGAQE